MNRGLEVAEMPHRRAFRLPMVYVYEDATWEYKTLSRDLAHEGLPNEEEMNALGAEGWELVGVIGQRDTAHYYFKRVRK